jgi:hypothetical protein
VILTTACNPQGWTAIVFSDIGHPICSTYGDDSTMLAALRNMLKHSSIHVNGYLEKYVAENNPRETKTLAGVDYSQSYPMDQSAEYADQIHSSLKWYIVPQTIMVLRKRLLLTRWISDT